MDNEKDLSKGEVASFITCDQVYVDPTTGKHSLLGVFSNLRAKEFPVKHPSMIWYLSLVEVPQGKHNLKIYFGVLPSEEEPKLIIDRDFESQGAHKRINVINDIKSLYFDEPNSYSIIIEIDGEVVFVDTFAVQDANSTENF